MDGPAPPAHLSALLCSPGATGCFAKAVFQALCGTGTGPCGATRHAWVPVPAKSPPPPCPWASYQTVSLSTHFLKRESYLADIVEEPAS